MVKKKKSLIKHAKEAVGIGIVSGAGLGAMGAMSNIPGMPVEVGGVTRAAGSGLALVGVGKMAEIGMALPKLMEGKTEKKKIGNKYIDKII